MKEPWWSIARTMGLVAGIKGTCCWNNAWDSVTRIIGLCVRTAETMGQKQGALLVGTTGSVARTVGFAAAIKGPRSKYHRVL